jgi:hypothetical protein
VQGGHGWFEEAGSQREKEGENEREGSCCEGYKGLRLFFLGIDFASLFFSPFSPLFFFLEKSCEGS